jgi:hypothetical protein
MCDRIQPGISFVYPRHAIRKPNRVISGLEMRIEMELGLSARQTGLNTGTCRVSTVPYIIISNPLPPPPPYIP